MTTSGEMKETFTLIPNTDHWEESDIIRTIEYINANSSNKTKNESEHIFTQQFPEFEKRYPALFRMACDKTFDREKLTYMMNMRRQVLDDKRSVESASRTVGDKFFREYVSPIVQTIPASQSKKPKVTVNETPI